MANKMTPNPNPFERPKDKPMSNPATSDSVARIKSPPPVAFNPFCRNPFAGGHRMRATLFDNSDAVGMNRAALTWSKTDGFFGSPSKFVIKQAEPINGALPLEDVTVFVEDEEDKPADGVAQKSGQEA